MTTTYHGSHSAIRPTATGTGGCRPAAFSGFHSPRYTMVPDALFDELMAYLSGAELKVLLYIIRRTFGFKKESDSISLNQICHGITTREGQVLDQGTGLSQSTVQLALKGLLEKQAIVAQRRSSPNRGYEATTYCLNLRHSLPSGDETGSPPSPIFGEAPFTENRQSPSPKISTALHRKSVIQQTERQQTEEQQTDEDLDSKDTPSREAPGDQHTRQPASSGREQGAVPAATAGSRQPDGDLSDAPLVDLVASLSTTFGDKARGSTLTRVRNLRQRLGTPIAVLIPRLREAATITSRQGHIAEEKRMAYLLTVLERLLTRPTAYSLEGSAPQRSRQATPASSEASDVSRYTGGSYGVCPQCLSSPCDSTCPDHPAAGYEQEAG